MSNTMTAALIQPEPWIGDDVWLAQQSIQRSYAGDVLVRLSALDQKTFKTETYGALTHDPARYPLKIVTVGEWDNTKPVVLITGGVHGYETSGVHGAIQFLETSAKSYSEKFNIIVAPCVSPWGYETINRWNPSAIDPNRSFNQESPTEETRFLMEFMKARGINPDFHMDLHETTDTDATVFRPALNSRNNTEYKPEIIPNGFYLVATANHIRPDLDAAIIEAVRKVTPIAPTGEDGLLIGKVPRLEGVVDYPENLGLCMNAFGAANKLGAYTTEIYPDGKGITATNCNDGQVAAIEGALEHLSLAA